MIFNTEHLDKALRAIQTNYRKILLVNLEEDTYDPILIPDDEWDKIPNDSKENIRRYWKWFLSSGLVHPDDISRCQLLGNIPDAGKYIIYRRLINNEWHWVLLEVIPVSDVPKTVLVYVRDIDNIYSAEYDVVVDKLGRTDPLTGLLNKTALKNDFTKFAGGYVNVVFCDLNGLKFINDTYGHKRGDDIILKFASLLSAGFPDFRCYHVSGDEFVVADFTSSETDRMKFIRSVSDFKRSLYSTTIPVASVGYAISSKGSLREALTEAESDMYKEKRTYYKLYPTYCRREEDSDGILKNNEGSF